MPTQIQNYVAACIAEHIPEVTLLVTSKAAELRAVGGPVNDKRAAALELAFVEMIDGYEIAAAEWAVKGTALLREHERASRVRPDTLGGGGPRLSDNLFTDVIPGLTGSLGIANEDVLDENVPWWPTNEFGSSTQVEEGRILFGAFFQPGPETRPNEESGQAQEHALFEPRGPGTFRGSGAVTHPIIAKRFIESAATEIEAGWRGDLEGLIGKFVASIP